MKETALAAARAGGALLRSKFGTRLHIEEKSAKDLVTEADREAEAAIVAVIQARFPEHNILAEEGDYPQTASPFRWIIDPLDGTTNFTHAFPWFAVSIALEEAGEIILGIVYQPYYEELFVAVKGQGATLNGQPLQVSAINRLDRALLATGFAPASSSSPASNFDHFVHFQEQAQACRRPGAASLDLACVAAGRFDGFWEMKLKPWDTAAGMLLVTEAGGRVSNFDGAPFSPENLECLASNGLIHDAMIPILQQGKRP
jgi:myo-inositol-1(or 4)-monophosphatase